MKKEQQKKLIQSIIKSDEGDNIYSEVAVNGCHNCKNNPHAPFVPEICDSCYADSFNNWQPLTDC